MLGVFLVNNVEAALSADDLIFRTPLLDTSTDFHNQFLLVRFNVPRKRRVAKVCAGPKSQSL